MPEVIWHVRVTHSLKICLVLKCISLHSVLPPKVSPTQFSEPTLPTSPDPTGEQRYLESDGPAHDPTHLPGPVLPRPGLDEETAAAWDSFLGVIALLPCLSTFPSSSLFLAALLGLQGHFSLISAVVMLVVNIIALSL